MNQGHPRDAAATPEERWRRTVDRRDRTKLKVRRLLRDFGFEELSADAVEQIEARLASVGVGVQPRLLNADAKGAVTLEITGPAPAEPTAEPTAEDSTEVPREDTRPQEADRPEDGPADESAEPHEERPQIEPVPAAHAAPATDPLGLARAESARLLEERSQVERRLEAGARELKVARQDVATLSDTVAATRLEVQRAADELRLALAGKTAPSANDEQPKHG
jgi:uncharacterized coiled-coil protein SlyX